MNYFKRPQPAPLTLTAEQAAQLSRFAGKGRPFSTALEANYVRALPAADLDELLAVYKDATGKDYPMHRSCGNCVYNFVRLMAKAYHKATEGVV